MSNEHGNRWPHDIPPHLLHHSAEVCCPPSLRREKLHGPLDTALPGPTVGNQQLEWGRILTPKVGHLFQPFWDIRNKKKHHFTTWQLKTLAARSNFTAPGYEAAHLSVPGSFQHAEWNIHQSFCTVCARNVGMYGPKEIEQIDCIFSSNKFVRDTYNHSVGQCIPLVDWVLLLPPFRGVISMIPSTLYQNQKTNPFRVGQLFLPPKMLRNQGGGTKTWTWIQFLWWKICTPPCKKLSSPFATMLFGYREMWWKTLSEMWMLSPGIGRTSSVRRVEFRVEFWHLFFYTKHRLKGGPFWWGDDIWIVVDVRAESTTVIN